ncbi:MAG: hypothetical protein JWS12_682 [Candidatus Saccharibacteria bacterium]|nr:hypothetical protein [Candidatus Saccharibacteria bacterium]
MKRRIKNRLVIYCSCLIIIAGGLGLGILGDKAVNDTPLKQYFQPSVNLRAVWDWTDLSKKDPSTWQATARSLQKRQINSVFIDISSLAHTTDKAAISRFSDRLTGYIASMQRQNISVYAAAGNTDWSKPDMQQYPLRVANYVFSYNHNNSKTPLQGLEFDIESYNQTDFASSPFFLKDQALTQYLDLVSKLVTNQQRLIKEDPNYSRINLGFTIPYWYDNENGNIESITWHDKTGPTLYHLMDTLNQLPATNVVVMAYRNAANGNDGAVAHSRTELAYAQAKAPHVKVVIGQETTDVQPSKITFYGHSLADFSQQINAISDQANTYGVFGGIAINDVDGYLQIQNKGY